MRFKKNTLLVASILIITTRSDTKRPFNPFPCFIQFKWFSVSVCNAGLVELHALRLSVIFIFYVDFALVLTSITVLKHWRQMMIFIKYQYMFMYLLVH